jgi:hypothetical protein
MKHVNDEIQQIHLCTTRPLDTNINIFNKLFQNDACNLINVCNPTCYKTNVDALKKLCRYNFLQPLINEIHFEKKNFYTLKE